MKETLKIESMPDKIPAQCAPLQSRVDSLTFQWHQLQEELAGADPSDRGPE